MYGFVFSVVYILLFTGILAAVPVGLQGGGGDIDLPVPIDPVYLTGFEETENYTRTAYTAGVGLYYYSYSMVNKDWQAVYTDIAEPNFFHTQKFTVVPIVWVYYVFNEFHNANGTNRGTSLTIDEIELDAVDGIVRYDMFSSERGDNQGALLFYWNETLYADPEDAWDNDVLHQVHGAGFASSATNDVLSLVLSVLLLQLPDVPPLLGLFIAAPTWACIAFVCWYLITALIPFVSGP